MNKHIKELINLYYNNEFNNYNKFSSRDTLNILYQEYIDMTYKNINDSYIKQLNEEYHITNIFDNVISDISLLYIKNINEKFIEIYTEWNFNNKTASCEKVNNINIKYPIYILIINEPNVNIYSSVIDKNESPDKIILQINSALIDKDIELLLASCKHEFLHIREMYALDNINILSKGKNKIPDEYIDNNIFMWNNSQLYYLMSLRLCYIFNLSEIRARLNATSLYASSLLYNKNKINSLLDAIEHITLLDEMINSVNKLNIFLDTKNYSALEIFHYYCYKFKLINTKISYNYNIRKNVSEYSNNDINIFNAMILSLEKIILLFRQDLIKIIYKTSIHLTPMNLLNNKTFDISYLMKIKKIMSHDKSGLTYNFIENSTENINGDKLLTKLCDYLDNNCEEIYGEAVRGIGVHYKSWIQYKDKDENYFIFIVRQGTPKRQCKYLVIAPTEFFKSFFN